MQTLAPESAKLFASEIARARSRGMRYFAKSYGCPSMRFGASIEEAEARAAKDARAVARANGCPGAPPAIRSGELPV